ncbi:MAG: DUF1553 domain-containing protein [Pirellulales bacterium]|nr:DUF1553 domain-containing protein [Pirellulales bacterium]
MWRGIGIRRGGRCLSWLIVWSCVTSPFLLADEASPGDEAPAIWSVAPVVRPEPPAVQDTDWCRNPIDRFILARLEQEGMQPAPDVSRAKLIRRVYFDLWGLPPSPEEVAAFVADDSPEAYPQLVERLLADQHFGERWARYWLDLVRFAETNGYERDAVKEHAWKYRDWVIESLVDDKPYDRFVLEQLAGDEIPDATPETLVATGMLRVGTFDDEPNDPLQYKYEQLDDLVHVTGTTFLALTIKCARCHDHKFDPIPQTDYYSFLNFFSAGKSAEGDVLGYTDASRDAPVIHLLKSGDPRAEGDEVPAGFPTLVPALARAVEPPPAEAKTTRRRLQLAQWITDAKNPLTPRVLVNRLWQHHFGQGLVRTPDNFGVMSDEPTHPELLDWLAAEVIERGWKMKDIHRLILLSRTYQMDSTHPAHDEYAERDFANERWWRANRRRLDVEALRDSLLAVSGDLNLQAGGPGFVPTVSVEALEGLSKKEAAWTASPPEEQRRRSIYMFTKRSLLLPLMTVFDLADTTQPCAQRSVTTVAPQALALLNNPFVHEQSEALARRVEREVGSDPGAQVERAWWLAFGRAPSETEREAAFAHLASQEAHYTKSNAAAPSAPVAAAEAGSVARHLALASLTHVLLNANEFVYVD